MSFDEFMNVIKGIDSPPTDVFCSFLSTGIKIANQGVHNTFFPNDTSHYSIAYDKAVVDQYVNTLAVEYLCFVMSKNTTNGFNNTISVKDMSLINDWFDKNSNRVGEPLLVGYMKNPDKLQSYFQDAGNWAITIAAEIGNKVFLDGLLDECQTNGGSNLPAKVLLVMLKALDNGGENFTRVLQVWKNNPNWESLLADYDSYLWLDNVKEGIALNTDFYNSVNQAVSAACNNNYDYYYETRKNPGNYTGYIAVSHYRQTTYGPAVRAWLDSAGGPAAYGLRSNGSENAPVTVCTDNTGCIAGGTLILMEDGSHKPVEQIREGDRVRSAHGFLSVCSSELVVNEHITQLYGINDDEPFMSFEHAVMTQRGWCCLAPHMAKDINPQLKISSLSVGDVVWKVAEVEDNKVAYKKEIVRKINTRTVRPEEEVVGFDLHFREGYHSYHAKDYLCLLNYPQITLQRITSNVLSHMSLSEQLAFPDQLDKMSPLLDKALGGFVTRAVKESLKHPKEIATRASSTDRHGVTKLHPAGTGAKTIPRLVVTSDSKSGPLPSNFETLSLMHGFLFINGEHVESHCDGDHMFWSRTGQDGTQEAGALKLQPHGLTGNGVVRCGETTSAFTVSAGQDGYTIVYSDEAGASHAWWEFTKGMENDSHGNWHTAGKLIDPTGAKQSELDKFSKVVFSMDEHKDGLKVFHFDVEFSASYCAFGGSKFIAAEFNFTADYKHFTGWLYGYDPASQDNRGRVLPIIGNSKDVVSIRNMMDKITAHYEASPINTSLPHLDIGSTISSPGLMAAFALIDDIPMSVNNLFGMSKPDMSLVHQEAFAKLKTLMMYSVDDQWRGWFGETKPKVGTNGDLTDSEAAIADDPDTKSFLKDQFALGYLTQAFSQSAEPRIRDKFNAMKDVQDKLSFFWKGDKPDNCFSQYKGYNLATAKITESVYSHNLAGFQRYLDNNQEQWASGLYAFCTDERTLPGLAKQNTPDGRARITHLTTMLHLLDPKTRIKRDDGTEITYATSLYEQVMNCRLNQIIVNSSTSDQEDMSDFLTAFFQHYFNSLIAGDKWKDDILADAKKDLEELMAEMKADNVNDLVLRTRDIIADAVSILVKYKDLPIAARINQWAKVNPKVLGSIRTGLTMGLYGYSMFSSIYAFLNWDKQTWESKSLAIINVADTTLAMFNDFSKFMAAKTLSAATASGEDLMAAVDELETLMESDHMALVNAMANIADDTLAEISAPALARAGQVVSEALQTATDLAGTASKWASISKVANVVGESMSLLALGATCVLTGFQIANDFATGQPLDIKIFDILGEVANGVAFLVEGGAGLAALLSIEVCSVIPVIGVVAAVVGIIVAIILALLPRTPPPTPQEIFVDGHCAPFITSKVKPGDEWLNQQKKIVEHLTKKSLLYNLS